MKTRTKRLILLAVLAVPTTAFAVLTRFDDVEVRESSDAANVVYSNGFAVGSGNDAHHDACAVGTGNTTLYSSQTVGANNWASANSQAVGVSNDVKNHGASVGLLNNVNFDAPGGQSPRGSLASGQLNYILGSYSFASGSDNDVTANRAVALGRGIVITTDKTTVVGEYNEDVAGLDMRFVVGNGEDAANRENAFEVHKNGDVIIHKPQGDISMGIFGY